MRKLSLDIRKFVCCMTFFSLCLPLSYAENHVESDSNVEMTPKRYRIETDILTLTRQSPQDSSSWGFLHEFGIDYYQKIVRGDKEVAKILLQVNWATLDGFPGAPGFFDGPNDGGELVLRNNYIEFPLDVGNGMDLRIGKFEIPYGLETSVVTQKELRQMMHQKNLRVKADWGVALRGALKKYEYQLSFLRGSGSDVTSLNFPRLDLSGHMVVGRIGNAMGAETIYGGKNGYGVSFADASIVTPNGTRKFWRVGIDAQLYRGPFGFLTEINYGEERNNNVNVANALFEFNTITPAQNLLAYTQFRSLQQEVDSWDDSNSVSIGLRYEITDFFAASVDYNRNLNDSDTQTEQNFFQVQTKWRF